MSDLSLKCAVTIEKRNQQSNAVNKTTVLKEAMISIVRDDEKRLIIRLTPYGSNSVLRSFGYTVAKLKVFKNFMHEGKATITLPALHTSIYLRNCAPDKLRLFLITLLTKARNLGLVSKPLKGLDENAKPSSLSMLEEVSPLRLERSKRKPSNLSPSRPTTSLNIAHSSPLAKRNTGLTSKETEQECVLRLVREGKNVFCTGSAGTGKSFLLRKVIGILRPESTAVTASTGAAATLIGGTTVHNFCGVGSLLDTDDCTDEEHWLRRCQARLAEWPAIASRWSKVNTLVIDEVSRLLLDST